MPGHVGCQTGQRMEEGGLGGGNTRFNPEAGLRYSHMGLRGKRGGRALAERLTLTHRGKDENMSNKPEVGPQ